MAGHIGRRRSLTTEHSFESSLSQINHLKAQISNKSAPRAFVMALYVLSGTPLLLTIRPAPVATAMPAPAR